MPIEETISQTLLQIQRTAAVSQVFGEPVTLGDQTVIPVAEVRYKFGFGFGSGQKPRSGKASEHGTEDSDNASAAGDARRTGQGGESGSGGGAGGHAAARAVGYLRVKDGEVKFEPVIDASRLALTAMALVGWLFFILTRCRKH